jgi:hypothetical protein
MAAFDDDLVDLDKFLLVSPVKGLLLVVLEEGGDFVEVLLE